MARAWTIALVDHQHWQALQQKNPNLTLDKDFRFWGGRDWPSSLLCVYGRFGVPVLPGSSIESPTGWDIIRFNDSLSRTYDPLDSGDRARDRSCLRACRATGAWTPTAAQRAQAAVLDECAARKREQKVLTEIRATAGQKALAGLTLHTYSHVRLRAGLVPVRPKRTSSTVRTRP